MLKRMKEVMESKESGMGTLTGCIDRFSVRVTFKFPDKSRQVFPGKHSEHEMNDVFGMAGGRGGSEADMEKRRENQCFQTF